MGKEFQKSVLSTLFNVVRLWAAFHTHMTAVRLFMAIESCIFIEGNFLKSVLNVVILRNICGTFKKYLAEIKPFISCLK